MQDNLSIVITMIVFVTLVVIFPLYNLFERQDDMSYTLALKATTTFVDEIRNNGYIDQKSYTDFIGQLSNTGNSYDVQMEGHRKTLILDDTTPLIPDDYIEQYKIDYTEDILNTINSGDANITGKSPNISNAYLLNQDDQIYVKLKNSSTTMAGAVFNAIIPTAKKERIVVDYGGVIKNNSWERVESTIHSFTTKPSAPIVTRGGLVISGGSITVDSGMPVQFTAASQPSDWWKHIVSYVWTFQYADGTVEQGIVTAASGTAPNLTGSITKSFPVQTPSTVSVYAVDNYGDNSESAIVTVNTVSIKPETPSLTSNPIISNSVVIPVAGGTVITFTAFSRPGSPYKTIAKYVWTIQNGGGSPYVRETTTGTYSDTFANGIGSITVYAVDSVGLASDKAGTGFLVMNNFAQQAISGVGVAKIDSILIPGATVAGYSFEVKVSPTHGGDDWWNIRGLTTGGVWESVKPGGLNPDADVRVSNGVSTGQVMLVDPYKYTQLSFQYSVDSGHIQCLNQNPYIKYSVQYKF